MQLARETFTPPDRASASAVLALCTCVLLSLGCAGPTAEPAPASSAPTLAEAERVTAATNDSAPGLIHTVLFWLREDLTAEERGSFVEDNRSLTDIPGVRKVYFGPPAATEARAVVDNSFDYALVLHFDDLAGHDAYQVHPKHVQMLEEHRDKFAKVVVYDSEVMQ